MLKIKIIQTQIKLTLPYPYKRQFYEDTQNEYCSAVVHTKDRRIISGYRLQNSYNRTR